MDMDEYQRLAAATARYRREDGVAYNAAQIAAEAGEVLGKVMKLARKHGLSSAAVVEPTRVDALAIGCELGDVLWHVAMLAKHLDLSLSHVAQSNLYRLADRDERGVIVGEGDNR